MQLFLRNLQCQCLYYMNNLLRMKREDCEFVCLICSKKEKKVKMVASVFTVSCYCFLLGSTVNDSSTSFTSSRCTTFPEGICWREMHVNKYC